MRLKTVAAEEAHTSYRVPTSLTHTQTKPREVYEERTEEHIEEHQAPAQLKKVRQPLAHPRRVAAISATFLVVLGGLHVLTVNEAPTYPRYQRLQESRSWQGPGVKEHLNAAESLLTGTAVLDLSEAPLAKKQAILAKNVLSLSLLHEAAQQKPAEFTLGYLNTLFEAQYDVALAAGNRATALEALTDLMKLHTLQLKGAVNTLHIRPNYFDGTIVRLGKTTFTPTETKALRTALAEAIRSEPNWKTLAAQAKAEALGVGLPQIISGKSELADYYGRTQQNKLNWDTVVNGQVLGQGIAQVQLQAALFRHGSQGIVDACTRYLDAREKQVLLLPAEAQRVTVPPLPQIPNGEVLDWHLENITRQREVWAKVKVNLEALQRKLAGTIH